MNNVIDKLKQEIKNLTSSQRRVADYILKQQTKAAFLTIEQLSKEAGTSTSTIMRVTSYLGYKGYSQFQQDLQELLRNQVPQARLKINLEDTDSDDLLIKCAQTQINNIRSTLELLSDDILESSINLLTQANNIYCVGQRTSYSVVHHLNRGLKRILGNSRLLTGEDFAEEVVNATTSDVLIAVTFPRYVKKTVQAAKVLQARGVKVISVTDGYSSPIAEFSDVVIPCKFESDAFQNSVIGPIFVCDYLISALTYKQIEKTNKRLEEVDSVIGELDSYYLSTKYNDK